MISYLFINNNISQACILKIKKEKLHNKIKVNMIYNSKTLQKLQRMKKMKIFFYLEVFLIIPTHSVICNLNNH
jgi:hypothetical protein